MGKRIYVRKKVEREGLNHPVITEADSKLIAEKIIDKALQEYDKVMQDLNVKGNNLDMEIMDSEDIVQSRLVTLLEIDAGVKPKEIKIGSKQVVRKGLSEYDSKHLAKSLRWYVKKRTIDVKRQQKDNLVSLNDNENGGKENSIQVSIPKNYDLFKHIVNQFDSEEKRIWSHRQLQVLSKRYIAGKNQVEIARDLDISKMAVSKICKVIDSKIINIDMCFCKSEYWYHPEQTGHKISNKSKLWDISHNGPGQFGIDGNQNPIKKISGNIPKPIKWSYSRLNPHAVKIHDSNRYIDGSQGVEPVACSLSSLSTNWKKTGYEITNMQ